jgi:hypothetical protein
MKATRGKVSTSKWRHGLAAAGTLVLVACGGGGESGPEGSNPMGTAGTGAGGEASGAGTGSGGAASGGAPDSMPPGGATGVAADVGTKAIHRLSNLEYDNTVRDLLGTQLRPSSGFQPDIEASGFTNIAEAISMNPRSVKDYYDAAVSLTDELALDATRLATIVTCQPAAAGDVACANQIIAAFGARAFRRPLEAWEATHYTAVYQAGLTNGLDHAGAIGHVVRTMLTAPQFLYRMEFDTDPLSPEQHALSAYELASRLSYMMWSSMPDQTLFDLAANGQLLQLDVLQAQVDRMLLDAKSSTLVDSFAWQWFGATRLATHEVNATQYPVWDETLRASMQNELKMFLDEFVHQGRPFPEILTRDVNYVDAKLAEVYGIPAPASGTQQVEFTTDERKGLLGLAGFLTHTSRHNRSAPTIRAAWVLNSLLCMDIAPPTNVVIAPLPEADPNVTSVRELIEAHRNNPACSGCHNIVDPVGLGMEQYDGIGRFRPQYENGDPIDTAGTLPDGTTFTGFSDMLDKLAAQTDATDPANPTLKTVQCAARKAFTYSMGRSIGVSTAYVDQMVQQWKGQPLSLANLFKQMVVNDVFRFRHGTPDAM